MILDSSHFHENNKSGLSCWVISSPPRSYLCCIMAVITTPDNVHHKLSSLSLIYTQQKRSKKRNPERYACLLILNCCKMLSTPTKQYIDEYHRFIVLCLNALLRSNGGARLTCDIQERRQTLLLRAAVHQTIPSSSASSFVWPYS